MLVLVDSKRPFSHADTRAVLEFVQHGGSLLVLCGAEGRGPCAGGARRPRRRKRDSNSNSKRTRKKKSRRRRSSRGDWCDGGGDDHDLDDDDDGEGEGGEEEVQGGSNLARARGGGGGKGTAAAAASASASASASATSPALTSASIFSSGIRSIVGETGNICCLNTLLAPFGIVLGNDAVVATRRTQSWRGEGGEGADVSGGGSGRCLALASAHHVSVPFLPFLPPSLPRPSPPPSVPSSLYPAPYPQLWRPGSTRVALHPTTVALSRCVRNKGKCWGQSKR